jgi:hypothetical protein
VGLSALSPKHFVFLQYVTVSDRTSISFPSEKCKIAGGSPPPRFLRLGGAQHHRFFLKSELLEKMPKNCYGKKPQAVFVVLWPLRNA